MSAPDAASPRTVKVLIGGFLVAAIAVTIWGFFVVGEARRTAARTDLEVRAMAWTLLAVAARDGAMPESEAALLDAAGRPRPDSIEPAGAGFPTTRAAAGLSADASDLDLPSAFERVRVVFAAGSPPRVVVVGLPTENGTLDEVNGWIEAWMKDRAGAAAR